MLQVSSINVYAFLDPVAILYFVKPLVTRKFDVLPDVFIEPFSVCTAMGDFVVAKTVHRKCPLILPNKVTLVNLVELDMFKFDIIFAMDRLHE